LIHIDLLNWSTVKNTVFRLPVYGGRTCNFDRKYLNPMGSIKLGATILSCPSNIEEFIKIRDAE
jgi:hypothetical protein